MSSNQRLVRSGLVAVGVMLAVAWLPTRALTHEGEGEVRGALTVDVALSGVTVGGTALQVTGDTRLEINDALVSLAALADYVTAHPGTQAEAEYRLSGSDKIARKVEVEDGPGGGEDEDELELHGALEADVANSIISVGRVSLAVDANTDLEAGDDHVALAAFADYLANHPGTRGEAHYQVVNGAKVATHVETKGSREDDGDDDDQDEEELIGSLSADTVAGTVSVGTVVIQVAIGTEIEVNRRHVSLSALATYLSQNPGTIGKVEYRQLDGQLVAREVKVLGAGVVNPVAEVEVSGVLANVSVSAGTFQVQPAGAEPLTLKVNAATEIQVDAARVTFGELPALLPADVEVRVRVHYDPTTLVARELELTIPVTVVQAQITQVSKGSRTLTLTTVQPSAAKRPKAPKLRAKVLAGATIIRGGTIIRLSDLRKGQSITLSTISGRKVKVSPEIVVAP